MSTPGNPNPGTPTHPDVATGCSALTTDELPGSAKEARVVIALEYVNNWGRDILDGEALGKELTGKLKKFLKANRAALHFIRKPGRHGQERSERPTRALYIAWAEGDDPVLEYMEVTGPEAILDLQLGAPGKTPGATVMSNPILLVCTHGKRDTCCAVFGRPLAQHLENLYPANVWESSHTKGHRFAPAMILLPANYSYGRVSAESGARLMDATVNGSLWLEGNRGRGVYDPVGQVAELAVAKQMQAAGMAVAPAQLRVTTPEVDKAARAAVKKEKKAREEAEGKLVERLVTDPASGEAFTVRLAKRPTGVVASSCGDKAKPAYGWVPAEIVPAT